MLGSALGVTLYHCLPVNNLPIKNVEEKKIQSTLRNETKLVEMGRENGKKRDKQVSSFVILFFPSAL